jgi:hypothetical protein
MRSMGWMDRLGEKFALVEQGNVMGVGVTKCIAVC